MAKAGAPENILILTGAGISAESGLGTFRDVGGLWDEYDLSEVATPEGYADNPDLVLSFYNARRENCVCAAPNAAHAALARLAEAHPGTVTLVTQNVDDLHERAGQREVIHMHGELMRALCGACGHRWAWTGAMARSHACPNCSTEGRVRPDVVWFGEIPYQMERIATALDQADLFVAIGTSGAVYPAAGFVGEARRNGAATLEINLERSDVATLFQEHLTGPATETVPAWVERVLARSG
ncbi:MAG: NAD-dependent deacylase [Pseudomonadota bacterium]